MDRGLLPIGTFSRASLLSIRALRHYDEIGLLRPVAVDPATGYRAYDPSQLTDAEVIHRLRQLDIPLDDIRRVLDERDPNVTLEVLGGHHARMRERLAQTELVVRSLQALVEQPTALLDGRIEVRHQERTPALACTITTDEAELSLALDQAYARLQQGLAAGGAATVGPPGAVYSGPEWNPDVITLQAFLPVARFDGAAHHHAGLEAIELPSCELAVALHEGPFDTMGDSYRALGSWLGATGARPTDVIQEHYLVGPSESPDPTRFRTEIVWRLAPAG